MAKKDKIQLTLIWGAVVLLGAALLIAYSVYVNTPASAQQSSDPCPAGTYNIGTIDEPICKNEPTGCPYGDSIPLGAACDKHAPQPEVQQTPVVEPQPSQPEAVSSCGK